MQLLWITKDICILSANLSLSVTVLSYKSIDLPQTLRQ